MPVDADLLVAAGERSPARPRVPPLPGESYVARARALLRKRFRHVLIIAAIAAALDLLRAWPAVEGRPQVAALLALNVIVFSMAAATLIVFAVSCAQAALLPLGRRTALMVAGAWAGVAVVLWFRLMEPTLRIASTLLLESPDALLDAVVMLSPNVLMYLGWQFAAIGTAVALFYAVREREARLATQAREAELAALRVQRTMMESRLAVLRARVEPEFLFGALAEVRALFGHDPVAADATIDALIAYLRTALPAMRGEASTVGRELDLVCAYVAVLQVPRGASLAVDARAQPGMREAVLPPMVLLPLVQAAFAGGETDRRRKFLVEAFGTADGVRVRVEVQGGHRPEAWRGEGPQTTNRTLKAFYGAEARLEFASDGTAHRAEVCIPRAHGSSAAERGTAPGGHGAPAAADGGVPSAPVAEPDGDIVARRGAGAACAGEPESVRTAASTDVATGWQGTPGALAGKTNF